MTAMEQLFLILELVGTLAFAASGAITGLKKNMDVFGVCILGLTTAVGGGVIRDLLLGITPPGTFQDPIYAVVALLTSLVLFLPRIRRLLMWDQRLYDLVLLIMDSAGLGIFTVAGIRIAYEHAARPTLFLLVFVGVVTGVGGGVLRDVLAGDTPYIFVKHVYASATLAGALACVVLWPLAGEMAAMLCGSALVVAVRILSAPFRWNLPHADDRTNGLSGSGEVVFCPGDSFTGRQCSSPDPPLFPRRPVEMPGSLLHLCHPCRDRIYTLRLPDKINRN